MRTICALTALAVLAGCAAPPNTPGAGSGDRYTPVIDMQGLDMVRYSADLANCRTYTKTINPAADAAAGAIIGALIGAAVGASVGHGTSYQGSLTRYGAGYGGTSGALQAGSRGVVKQETIMANCMAGRGYRTLDASIPVNTAVVSPYGPQVVASLGGTPAALPAQAAYMPAVYAPAVPPAAVRADFRPTGNDTYNAEQLARTQSCAAQPVASLSAKGGGFETYSVPCSNGDTIAIRCEFGNCRILQ